MVYLALVCQQWFLEVLWVAGEVGASVPSHPINARLCWRGVWRPWALSHVPCTIPEKYLLCSGARYHAAVQHTEMP